MIVDVHLWPKLKEEPGTDIDFTDILTAQAYELHICCQPEISFWSQPQDTLSTI